ncbi:hypothetical protein CC86DRAFT_195663 [Ophiobolus disseminans]|uniref:Uncharacterized protein n=1 Tax=Ophiobolus disseminans TaxID=1469910 RepID=A0A6A7A634_9PLEO|nr:hypothetical protein CC86DRAFT_195663 [Ophiobolus disseminans]
MQSAASKRALSFLAAKLHPQLPLSARESQQLLTLLTTSFRAHLDREHPVPHYKNAQKPSGSHAQRSPSPSRVPASYASATRHIDSIVTNPLFAVKPRRRASDPTAVDVLRDPVGWFIDQIATGAATLPKAATCLDLLEIAPETSSRLYNGKSRAFVLAEWLRSSGLDKSREFVELHSSKPKQGFGNMALQRLVTLLFAEGEAAAPWRWFIRSQDQRVRETALDANKVATFRQHLLWKMVFSQANLSLDVGLAVFMQAFRMAEMEGIESSYTVLRPAGAHLVNRIVATPDYTIEPQLYQSFLISSRQWLGNWSQAVESMLWLNHPTQKTATPALEYIRDPSGAVSHAHATQSRRHFLVQLCLGVARQLLEEERYTEAQVAMQFIKDHFSDIVLSKPPVAVPQTSSRAKERKEKENLELLDRLIPT